MLRPLVQIIGRRPHTHFNRHPFLSGCPVEAQAVTTDEPNHLFEFVPTDRPSDHPWRRLGSDTRFSVLPTPAHHLRAHVVVHRNLILSQWEIRRRGRFRRHDIPLGYHRLGVPPDRVQPEFRGDQRSQLVLGRTVRGRRERRDGVGGW